MRLLVYTPTIGDEMRAETRASIESQITDIEFDWEIGFHNPFQGVDFSKTKNVVAQYQRAQEMCLAGGYDALLTVEHDMIIPPDTIGKLCATDALVVYGIYMLRHGTPCLNAWQYINKANLGMSLSLYPDEIKEAREQGWWEVCGTGWGCTLIRREVLESYKIHSKGDQDAGDISFAHHCVKAGIRQIARFDVPCGHILPDGFVLDPYKNGGIVSRVEALVAMNALVGGVSMPLKQGRYYTMPPDDARDLQRAGYVRITNDSDSQDDIGEKEQPDIGEREMATDPKARGMEKPEMKTRRGRAQK